MANALIEVQIFVAIVLAKHQLRRGQAVFVAGQLVAELLLVTGQTEFTTVAQSS